MSERDRHNRDDFGSQFGSNYRGSEGRGSDQANQWQSDGNRQQGGYLQGDNRGRGDDQDGAYRFSGQGSPYGGGARSQQGSRTYGSGRDHDLYTSNHDRSRPEYGQHNDREQPARYQQGWQRDDAQGRYGQQGSQANDPRYAGGRDFDASGGNDFSSFTSEDFGGRDFSNRSGGVTGGARSSESYRPSYGLSSWFNDDDDRQQGRSGRSSGREDFGNWRQYGESRGFLQRAGDEVASWFGDEEASRRRDQDHRHDQSQDSSRSHRGRGPSNYTRSDERIREDANDHLTHDHHVDASHITVSVKDGELTLDGTVDSRHAKRRAEDTVEHISGVKHVQNNLRVQDRSANYGSSSYSGTSAFDGGATYGQSGGASSGSSLRGSSAASGAGSSTTASSGTATPGQTGASTTGGIGSSATAGVGSASATRSSDKPS